MNAKGLKKRELSSVYEAYLGKAEPSEVRIVELFFSIYIE